MNNCFIVIFGLWQEKLVFLAKFLARLSKALFTYPEEHLQSNIFERNSWKFEQFRITFEVFGTIAENLFQGWKNSNRCPGNRFWEKKTFSKEKNSLFYPILSNFFNSSEKFHQICESRNLRIGGSFWGKNFGSLYNLSHFFRTLIQKTLSRNNFSRVVTTAIRASRGIFWGKVFFF